jgi:hypothetical protein
MALLAENAVLSYTLQVGVRKRDAGGLGLSNGRSWSDSCRKDSGPGCNQNRATDLPFNRMRGDAIAERHRELSFFVAAEQGAESGGLRPITRDPLPRHKGTSCLRSGGSRQNGNLTTIHPSITCKEARLTSGADCSHFCCWISNGPEACHTRNSPLQTLASRGRPPAHEAEGRELAPELDSLLFSRAVGPVAEPCWPFGRRLWRCKIAGFNEVRNECLSFCPCEGRSTEPKALQ